MSENSQHLNDIRRDTDGTGEGFFSSPVSELPAKKKKKSVLKFQKQLIAFFLVLVILLSVAYAIVYKIVSRNVFIDEKGDGAKYYVMQKAGKYVITDKDEYTLSKTEDGDHYVTGAGNVVDVDEDTGEVSYYAYVDTEGLEEVGPQDRLLIFPHTEKKQMAKIEVHNEHGSFTFKREKLADGSTDFVIRGNEEIPYNPELFAQLVVATGYTLTIQKIDNELSAKYGLKEYGLVEEERVDEDGNKYTYKPAWYRITDLEGNEYKVIIGDKIVSNAGYYVKLDSRDSVYIVTNTTFDASVLVPIETLCSPVISAPGTTGDYFDVTNFLFWNDPTPIEDPFSVKPMITFDYMDLEERNNTEFQTTPYYRFDELIITEENGKETKYDVSPKIGGYEVNEYLIDEILQTLYLLPSRKEGIRVEKIGTTSEDLEKYGLDKPASRMLYKYKDITHDIFFSEMTEQGTYYVLSAIYDMVVEIDKKYLPFLEYHDSKFMSRDLAPFNIAFLKQIEISAPGTQITFLCDNSKSDMSQKPASDKLEVSVKETGKGVDREQFRDFFISLVYSEFEGESDLTEDEIKKLVSDEKNLILTLRYKTGYRDVEVKCYRYSERRAYITMNGVGGLYMLVPQLEKIISDAQKVISGEPISGTDKYDR